MNANMEPARPKWSAQTKLIVSLILLVGFGYLMVRFSPAIRPLILAVILAYVLSPLVQKLQRLGLKRGPSILLVYMGLLLIVAALLMVLIPMTVKQFKNFSANTEQLMTRASELSRGTYEIAGVTIQGEEVMDNLRSSLEGAVQVFLGQSLAVAGDVLTSLVWVVFIVIISVYLVKDGAAIGRWFLEHSPMSYHADIVLLKNEIDTVWGAFFRGQLLLSTLVSGIITLECLVLGMPYALVMGILAGLLEFMPSVGHAIWLSLASLLALVFGSTWMPVPHWVFFLIVLAFHIAFTQFDLNYLIPLIIGRSVKLSPLVVILGIVAGGYLLGVLGVVLAAPTIATLRILGRYVLGRLMDDDLLEEGVELVRLPPPRLKFWKRKQGIR